MSGKVVHALSGAPYDVYVGRQSKRQGLPESPWANRFRIGKDGDREEVLRRFEQKERELAESLPNTYAMQIAELRGKTLACWCAPKDRALTIEDETVCHGQILLRLAEELS